MGEANHPYRATIDPISGAGKRPIWSVMIPTYHCAAHLGETLASVLAEDAGPEEMQIEVVDDHSTSDDPQAVINAVGRGRIGFFRQETNVGHTRNFDTCIRRARGRLVHLLHGDDLVRPGFYTAMQRAFDQEPAIGAAFCRNDFIDEHSQVQSIAPVVQPFRGILEHGLERLAEEQHIMTPSMVVRRDVYERVGGFDSRLVCAEDWEMWVRIAAHYDIWYETEPLAAYRMHLSSNTGRHISTGDDINFTCLAIDLFKAYLPPDVAARVVPRAKQTYAHSALRMARSLLARGQWAAAHSQIRAALGCSRAPGVWGHMLGLGPLMGVAYAKRLVSRRSTSSHGTS